MHSLYHHVVKKMGRGAEPPTPCVAGSARTVVTLLLIEVVVHMYWPLKTIN